MSTSITIPRDHLAELTQALIDANALLDDLCRGQHIHPDHNSSDRRLVVQNIRQTYFPEIPNNRPLWPQRNAST
jgi:hypothetical protein